jgi:nucleolar pre-ribosomal-associated protein 1
LSALLTLLSSHYTFQSFGQPIIKALLSPPWMRRLNSYLGSSDNELILVTLKLFNAMSAFSSGRERKAVLEAFAWETKVCVASRIRHSIFTPVYQSLPKLLNKRRKAKKDMSTNVLGRPGQSSMQCHMHGAPYSFRTDIRTLYVLFLLSFVETVSPTSLKATFLERHRDAFLLIFKGLVQDPYLLVRKVLEVCWAGIWSDSKLKRSLKISVFSESVISRVSVYALCLHSPSDIVQFIDNRAL